MSRGSDLPEGIVWSVVIGSLMYALVWLALL
jgi:hypothetical protein